MPLARMMLSSSQRCASKRRTCGSPRLSRTGCGGRITFITFTLVVACCEKAAGAQSLGLAADSFEDRRPARELILENARRRGGPDIAHRLEAEPDELALEFAVGQRLLGDRVDALEDRRRRAGRRENSEGGLRPPCRPARLEPSGEGREGGGGLGGVLENAGRGGGACGGDGGGEWAGWGWPTAWGFARRSRR